MSLFAALAIRKMRLFPSMSRDAWHELHGMMQWISGASRSVSETLNRVCILLLYGIKYTFSNVKECAST